MNRQNENMQEFQALMEAYFDGATTRAQERRLYELAWKEDADGASEDVKLIRDISLQDPEFTGLAAASAGAAVGGGEAESFLDSVVQKPRKRSASVLRRYLIPCGIAAAVGAVVLLVPLTATDPQQGASPIRPAIAQAQAAAVEEAASAEEAAAPETVKADDTEAVKATRGPKTAERKRIPAPKREETEAEQLASTVRQLAESGHNGTEIEITDEEEAARIAQASFELLASNINKARGGIVESHDALLILDEKLKAVL